MRTLVTGGNRYIGLDLVRELAAAGHEVTVINSHEAPLPEGVRRIHANRREPGALTAALRDERDAFDVIFDHTAYQVSDVEPLVELFRGRIRHYVFTSSQAVYRRSLVLPIQESFRRHAPDDDDPRKSYGVGKVRCEDYLLRLWQREGFPATCLRVGHTLGPRSPQPTRDPWFFARLEAGRPILVPGEGFGALQLVHINDVARLMTALIGNERVIGRAYNVGGAEVTTVAGVVHLIARALGTTKADIVNVPLPIIRRHPPVMHWGEGMVGSAFMSIEAALRDIEWAPRFGIEDGYRDAWRWYDGEGRANYAYDYSVEDAILAELGRSARWSV
jgi:nucleoside-diphosphate-sugar epimerase